MSELVLILIAFGGGIFGAAIGAIMSFFFVGLLVLLGIAFLAMGATPDLLGGITFGAFGPHVGGFASGAAAAAFAARKGMLGGNGRDIVTPLVGLGRPDVLLVGGLFAVIGYGIIRVFNLVGFPWTDTVALTVFISAIIVRLVFGKSGLFGKVQGDQTRFSPNEETLWLPWQSKLPQTGVIGLGAGLLGAGLALALGADNGGVLLGFGISAISLILLNIGMKVPVTHHMTLPAAIAAVATGSLIWGVIFGILGAYVGEFLARAFNIHGDTHIDPPAGAIAIMTSLSLILIAIGLF